MRLEDFEKTFGGFLDEFKQQSFVARQAAVKAGAEVMKSALENAVPRDTGELSKSFVIAQYPDKDYIGSTRTVDGLGRDGRYRKGIPLINILEYDESRTPIVRTTYETNEQRIFETMKNKLQEELRK